MTTDVVRVEYGTPFKEVARLLADHGISGLPVVDEDGMVIGVISETDLVARQAVLIALAAAGAGATWGLGRAWARLPFVSRNRWLM